MTDDSGDGLLADVSVGDAVILAVLTIVGIMGFYLSPVDTGTLTSLAFGDLLSVSTMFLAALVFPIAWIANMSFERFRIESLAAFLVLPGVFRGGLFAVVCLGLPIAVVFASYLARSTYNGKNPFWTCFKAGASLVTVMAVLMATAGAYSMATDQDMRDTVRQGVTDRVADRATEVANETINGGGDGALEQQQQMLVTMTSQVARNVSASTILFSRRSVTATMDQLDGTSEEFSSTQRTVIAQTFDRLDQQVPQNISRQVTDRIEQRFEDQGGLQPSEGQLEDEVRDRVDAGLDAIFEDRRALAGMTFVMVLSLVYALKIPFELLGGVFGYLLYRLVA
jgi:hypothetical protein